MLLAAWCVALPLLLGTKSLTKSCQVLVGNVQDKVAILVG
jgi:hypothetical protein